jgi:hypothetical protein
MSVVSELYVKECRICGEMFEAENKAHRICSRCREEALQQKQKKQAKVFRCERCGGAITGVRHRHLAKLPAKMRKRMLFCVECENDREFLELELKARGYRNNNLKYVDGVPFCPDCDMPMVKDASKWCCSNDFCGVINIQQKYRDFVRINRDHTMGRVVVS